MAVVLIQSTNEYVGLTSDTKPTDGVTPGSIFWAYNSGTGAATRYIYTGSAWALDTSAAAGGSGGGAATIADGADVAEGAVADAAVAAGAAGTVSAKLRRITTDLNTLLGYADGLETLLAAATPAGEAVIGKVVGVLTNPTSTLTRVADTNAYAQNDLVATNVTAGSVVVPSVTVARVAAGSLFARRFRLTTNKTSGWDAVALRLRFWTAAPTYTNGDNGAYAVATGAAGYLGKADVALEQFADGASGIAVPYVGSEIGLALASGQLIYWDVQYIGAAALTPASGQTFVLTPEVVQN